MIVQQALQGDVMKNRRKSLKLHQVVTSPELGLTFHQIQYELTR
jgi:hypothetical protein